MFDHKPANIFGVICSYPLESFYHPNLLSLTKSHRPCLEGRLPDGRLKHRGLEKLWAMTNETSPSDEPLRSKITMTMTVTITISIAIAIISIITRVDHRF